MTGVPDDTLPAGWLDLIEAIADPLLAMDTDGRLFYANPAARRALGLSQDELAALTCHDICNCDQGGKQCFLRDVVGAGKIYREESMALVNLTGAEINAIVTASPIIVDGEIVGGVQVYRPTSRTGGVVRELERLAAEDELTGLVNRRELMRRMEIEIARAIRHRRALSTLMMDLDHFKEYNDSQGHLAGDAALRLASDIIRGQCRVEDVAGRYGGDEMFVVLPETGTENAKLIAERIRHALAESEEIDPPITMSIGLYTWPGSGELKSQEAIKRADQALYEAKRLGRNRVELAITDSTAKA